MEKSENKLASFDHFFEREILAELGRVKYKDLEDIFYRMELTYYEIVDILDVEYISGSTIGYTLPEGFYGVCIIT